jgi:FkbM family methyltransferase
LQRKLAGDLIYRVTTLDQFSIEYGMFNFQEYAAAILDYRVESFIDLGCNAGWFALWLASRIGRRDFTGLLIDANPQMIDEARWHMRRNSLLRCGVVHGVVGFDTHQSAAKFYVNPSSASSSALPYQIDVQQPLKGRITEVMVPTVDVATEWQKHFGSIPVDLLKIDIEGMELKFVSHEGDFLRAQVKRIVMEWHKWIVQLATIDEALDRLGFERRSVHNESETLGVAIYDNMRLAPTQT